MDSSGLVTEMVSMNCAVKLTFRNTASFLGVPVPSTSLDLSYSKLNLATGIITKLCQSRKSQRSLTVMVKGSRIPLYEGGAMLSSLNGAPIQPVPFILKFMLR
ncbi:PROTEIN putative-RELATED [Salix viminalis]|uniref:PROTEIN putative-RELATED n=1 Tax=Salix viminalis TaxID=40686 RepID=A0A9Q0UUF9_SALVM|nr:PROTEIN putative-RELATED [Salix viminalis]